MGSLHGEGVERGGKYETTVSEPDPELTLALEGCHHLHHKLVQATQLESGTDVLALETEARGSNPRFARP